MAVLIPLQTLTLNGEQVNTVDARELHGFLEVKTRFNDWIVNRINDFSFVEGQDFLSFTKNLVKPNGGRPSTEYHLSISMAKELCMVERNSKGKEARLYFIECERVARERRSPRLPNFSDPAQAARAWADQYEKARIAEEKALSLTLQVEHDAPKVAYAEQVTASKEHMTITEVAKLLDFPPRAMKDFIRRIGWIYANKDTPMQSAIKSGLLVLRTGRFTRSDGTPDSRAYPHVTHKGALTLYRRLLDEHLISRNEKLELAFA